MDYRWNKIKFTYHNMTCYLLHTLNNSCLLRSTENMRKQSRVNLGLLYWDVRLIFAFYVGKVGNSKSSCTVQQAAFSVVVLRRCTLCRVWDFSLFLMNLSSFASMFTTTILKLSIWHVGGRHIGQNLATVRHHENLGKKKKIEKIAESQIVSVSFIDCY